MLRADDLDADRCYVIGDHDIVATHHAESGRWSGPGKTLVILDGPREAHESLAGRGESFHTYPVDTWHVAGVHSDPRHLCSGDPTTPCVRCGTPR